MQRPIKAYIDLSALTHNLSIARQYAPKAKIMAVIKANAYGHGLLHTANALVKADGFALLELEAAICLRNAGFQHPILLLEGFFSTQELALLEKHKLSTVIHNDEQLAMLTGCKHRELSIFIKINTGMNRLGFAPQQFSAVVEQLSSNPAVSQISLMTHFATADGITNNARFRDQLQVFDQTIGSTPMPCSLANSAATIRYPSAHRDWVRPGLMLYGASPFTTHTGTSFNLKPVMTLTSKIIAIHHLKQGDIVGYSGSFQADKPMRIGIVACGYADGYPRHAPTGTAVLVNNQKSRLVGKVSMDMLAIDLTELPEIPINSPVTLWGNGLPVEEIARAAGTISYELLCALPTRVELDILNEDIQDDFTRVCLESK
ncbi:alanine racemase [Nitrosomonas sp.]|uniref:alanine racemase n=1 Tax=Nitrosomonas sp. TaxID=42353 RepID=UPI001DF15051|nr:alanine racemase [Nitrosomonas sp.]MCB1949447.1 alanine racemase [Nitrosomonas sp.]MCP5243175.1 alanine racemase [Burkholderiales bacterium]MDR4513956.1 alanine racemase [Nitrosomonas sp.]